MGRRGERMLEAATDALSRRDAERAQQLDELDNLVDDLNRTVVEQVLEIGGDHARREWGLRMVLVARALERIADNAVDIAEQASYVVTGELREFSDASHPDERPARPRSPQGLRARMIADAACSWTRCVSVISMSSSPASARARSNSARVSAPAMQPVHCAMSARVASSMSVVRDHVGDGEAAAGRSTRAASRSTARLVAGEVDHAVGDDDVDGRVGQRHRPRCSP